MCLKSRPSSFAKHFHDLSWSSSILPVLGHQNTFEIGTVKHIANHLYAEYLHFDRNLSLLQCIKFDVSSLVLTL